MIARPLSGLALPAAALLFALLLASAAIIFVGQSDERAAEIAPQESSHPEVMTAGAFDPPHMAPEFALSGSDGSKVTLARYRGKVVLLSFGFTYCAAVCPTTLATLAQARAALGEAANSVQVIFITVDPERDDSAHMNQYLAAFDPSFIGATGSSKDLAAVREQYGVSAVRQGSGPDYVMSHSSSIFLIDRAGRLRAMMPFGHEARDFVHDIKLLLAS